MDVVVLTNPWCIQVGLRNKFILANYRTKFVRVWTWRMAIDDVMKLLILNRLTSVRFAKQKHPFIARRCGTASQELLEVGIALFLLVHGYRPSAHVLLRRRQTPQPPQYCCVTDNNILQRALCVYSSAATIRFAWPQYYWAEPLLQQECGHIFFLGGGGWCQGII